jgi:ABC-type tungstate transport system permease subunit
MGDLKQAIEHLERGEWQAAHEIVQADSSDLASWAHAIVHLLEGDEANAAYWYKRAGRAMPDTLDLDEEIQTLKLSD